MISGGYHIIIVIMCHNKHMIQSFCLIFLCNECHKFSKIYLYHIKNRYSQTVNVWVSYAALCTRKMAQTVWFLDACVFMTPIPWGSTLGLLWPEPWMDLHTNTCQVCFLSHSQRVDWTFCSAGHDQSKWVGGCQWWWDRGKDDCTHISEVDLHMCPCVVVVFY